MITGYISYHQRNYLDTFCNLKNFSIESISEHKDTQKMTFLANHGLYHVFILHIQSIFQECISRHPESNFLRLSYALFLIERVNNFMIAFAELEKVENNYPNLLCQCLIYQYRKAIKQELLKRKHEDMDEANITALLAYENYYASFREMIEKVAILHVQFWETLLEESPNQQRLEKMGHKILHICKEIEIYWEKMQILNCESLKAMKIYSLFMSDIIQDNESSSLIIERFKSMSARKQSRQALSKHSMTLSDVSLESTPCVCISGQLQNIGKINQCNATFCRLFCCNRRELIGKSINKFMPNIFAEFHNEILSANATAILRGESNNSLIKEKHIFGKSQNGYIFPALLRITSTPSLLNDFNFIGCFHIDKKAETAEIIHLIINKAGIITDISSSAMLFFGTKVKELVSQKANISAICPEFINKLPKFFQRKNGTNVKCYIPNYTDVTNIYYDPSFAIPNTIENQVIEMRCKCSLIKPQDVEKIGYYIQLESIEDNEQYKGSEIVYDTPDFQFKYNEILDKFVRVIPTDTLISESENNCEEKTKSYAVQMSNFLRKKQTASNKLSVEEDSQVSLPEKDLSKFTQQNSSAFYKFLLQSLENFTKHYSSKQGFSIETLNDCLGERINKMKVNYGEGIKILRLEHDKIVEVEDSQPQLYMISQHLTIPDKVESELGKESEYARDYKILFSNNIKSRKALEVLLSEVPYSSLTWAALITFISTLSLSGFALVFFFELSTYFQNVSNYLDIINNNYGRVVNEEFMMYSVRELLLIKE